ncbi:tripartite tricarboxylate transporter TctB family protein [Rhizobium sp. SSA_523]|uniref:tripartite tricarboxylate transporter TctB family protein n=1 Tax=Rhizobium sp. SSA_523 TaxID=2952477 RepID=UPI0020919B27|nr:tripartite tricarboxylate transporter TctB family protein [Rhizobium sp. SSA_523]MCO5731304.1 tripartite tricarboxylate transporter TctB family protein [Rhizobium sp. SSA_523]WKC22163.1 tripartite tricarboxylate transporter TctB family protein [Rhizobium sp. SSA_523]
MLPFIHAPKDFWAGVIYICLGSGFALIASGYSFGTAIRMGPGYFPTVLGCLLACVGLISAIRGITRSGEALEPFAWRPVVFVSLSLLLFALLLPGGGLILALATLLLIAPAAAPSFGYSISGGIAAIALIAFCGMVFVWALGLPLPLLGSWFTA